ncbi:hypothetical protein TcWFU_006614 [Taenia crassiceps]|uniref:Uncharacterized protein n=1 Tax=Taenia crassiceps TaxID=6207 RepID=A0ABR4QRB6_9CEST
MPHGHVIILGFQPTATVQRFGSSHRKALHDQPLWSSMTLKQYGSLENCFKALCLALIVSSKLTDAAHFRF